jgi:hypothetical protein
LRVVIARRIRFQSVMDSESEPSKQRVSAAADLETLVGIHVTGEVPDVFWADSHGHFQFATETEARDAMSDPYYQGFLPDVDWTQTVIRKVNVYRGYCSDPAFLWQVIERASERHGALSVVKKQGRWWASFGNAGKKDARTAAVAVCLAALEAAGVAVEINHDRVDADLNRKPDTEEERIPPDVGGFN